MTTTICFGRFRLIHTGHLSIFDNCDIVFMSETSRETDSVEVARELGYNAQYARTVVTAIESVEDDNIILIVGEDRANMVSLERSFPQLRVIVMPRPEGAASSTACRALIAEGGDLVAAGLANSQFHAELINQQYLMEC